MRKIKNFKISIRPREISRILRKLLNTTDLAIEIEEAVQRSCFYFNKTIKPAVVYDSFSKESTICSFEDIQTPEKWIALSPYIVTIGNELQEEFEKKKDIFGQYTVQIVSAISADTLEQSKNFVQKLISSEAEKEHCDISRNIEVPNKFYHEICDVLSTEKINVSLSEDNKFFPSNTITGIYYWIPRKRRTKK